MRNSLENRECSFFLLAAASPNLHYIGAPLIYKWNTANRTTVSAQGIAVDHMFKVIKSQRSYLMCEAILITMDLRCISSESESQDARRLAN